MANSSARRKKIPEAVQTKILVESLRRCCFCFHFNQDSGEKKGQIAHIDHSRNNNVESNLAYLCLDHHDAYDSGPSQSKGYTQAELRHAKSALIQHLAKQHTNERVTLEITFDANFAASSPAARDLLTKLLDQIRPLQPVKPIKTETGSIKHTIELSAEDAIRLINSFQAGHLANLRVTRISQPKIKLDEATYDAENMHGVSREQATEIRRNPDSVLSLGNAEMLYVKRVSDKYSVIYFFTPKHGVAYPINHRYIPLPHSVSPLDALRMFTDVFALPMQVNGVLTRLVWDDYISSSTLDSGKPNFIGLIESILLETRERYEWRATLKKSPIDFVAQFKYAFCLDSDKYHPTLRELGFKPFRSESGWIVR